jgi:hypothetical protein
MRYSSTMFTYSGKTFVSEISTLQFDPNQMDQIYPDAADEGFTMVSDKTGQEVKFVYSHGEFDSDGDLTVMVFVVDPYAIRKNPRLEGVEAHLLND